MDTSHDNAIELSDEDKVIPEIKYECELFTKMWLLVIKVTNILVKLNKVIKIKLKLIHIDLDHTADVQWVNC